MERRCPVCEGTIPASAAHCPKCGFPTALARELGPVSLGDVRDDVPDEAPMPEALVPRQPPSPEAEVNATIARTLEERTALLHTIDRDAPNVTGELCEAALNEASGRVADAQQILRTALGRLDRETEELFARHLAELETRGRALEATGLRVALEDELARVAESIVAGDPATSAAALAAAERRVDSLEAHWRGLQGLIAQVATLRQEAADLGIPIGPPSPKLEAARANLAAMPATERDLDTAAQAAAEALMELHEAIPPALEQELGQHGRAIDGRPAHHPKAESARRLHTTARRHLSDGRLQDAVQTVRELREVVADLAAEPAALPPAQPEPTPLPVAPVASPAPAPPPPAAEPAPPVERVAPPEPPAPLVEEPPVEAAPVAPLDPREVAALTKKVRALAVRVRALPADSPEAAAAAGQIHEATDLLRQRRYAEADAALTRLMRSLAHPASRS